MSENKKLPGQPTKYKPEYCQQLIDYFSAAPYKEVQKQIVTKNGVAEITVKEPNDIPSLAGFAIKLGVHRETLLNWCNEDPQFFDTYKMVKEYQENYLLINGVKNLIPTNFATFLLINHSKYRQKALDEAPDTQINQTIGNVSEEELDARIAEKLKKLEGKK